MLTSIDFWVIKNIVGRKLVKMRWWFIIDDAGHERWYYESKSKNAQQNHFENSIFKIKSIAGNILF